MYNEVVNLMKARAILHNAWKQCITEYGSGSAVGTMVYRARNYVDAQAEQTLRGSVERAKPDFSYRTIRQQLGFM